MANSNRTNNVLHNWRRVDFDSPVQTHTDEDLEVQLSFTVNNNSTLTDSAVSTEISDTLIGYDIADAISPSQIVTNPIDSLSTRIDATTRLSDRVRIGDLPQMDHIDAINRLTVAPYVYGDFTHTLTVDEIPPLNPYYVRDFVSGISTTFAKPFITVSCGFEVFDGYLICSSQSWYEVRIEVIHKPSQEVLDLILKIYEGSKWEGRVK